MLRTPAGESKCQEREGAVVRRRGSGALLWAWSTPENISLGSLGLRRTTAGLTYGKVAVAADSGPLFSGLLGTVLARPPFIHLER